MSRLERVPILGSLITEFNQDLKEFGLQKGVSVFLGDFGIKTKVIWEDDETKYCLQNKPTILVANHPNYIEPLLLLASLPSRKDIYLTGNVFFKGICSTIDNYLIPFYVRHRLFSKGRGLMGLAMDYFHPYEVLSAIEETKRNVGSINDAGRKLSQGACLLIFPEAAKLNQSSKWATGIGHLIRKIDSQDDIYLVKAYLETHRFDLVRFLTRACRILPPIKVTYSTPLQIKEFQDNSGKGITQYLKEDFNHWVHQQKV